MSEFTYVFKCRLPAGTQCTVDHLQNVNTLGDLKDTLFSLTDINPNNLSIMYGVPPVRVTDQSDDILLATIFKNQRETLIIKQIVPDANGTNAMTLQEQADLEAALSESRATVRSSSPLACNSITGFLLRESVPANNSCLFTSVHFCLTNGLFDPSVGKSMRKVIANTVQSDPEFYNEAFLGKPNSEYIKWILDDEHWGGAIELFILSNHHKIEIVAVDTQNERLNRFGEDKNYDSRILVIYDGIHYDALYFSYHDAQNCPNSNNMVTKFPTTNTDILDMALELGKEAKASRQFTDVKNFKLRCIVCQVGLTGQEEARQHAKLTGHFNFGEI